jgi:uncharacterized delta-60 repeat protein
MKKIIIALFMVVSFYSNAQPGTLDTTFNSGDLGFGNGANDDIYTSNIQSDGKIIIGGNFTTYKEALCNRIARLNNDGSLDTSFNSGVGASGVVWASVVQNDERIIIGGEFTSYNGTSINRIARLNSDGSLDTSFNPGTGANGIIYTFAIQSNGKIIIGGDFTSYNGTTRNRIARLNNDGSLDTSFNPGTGAENKIYKLDIQSDGKIIISGAFTICNGTSINRIARLNSDGTLDTSFNPGTGANNVIYTTALQSDGKIIIGGAFTSINGNSFFRIARLNSDGSIDTSFSSGTGAGNSGTAFPSNGNVWAIAIQSNGKIIIGGAFASYNGTSLNRIARLNSNGSLDVTFDFGTGANGIIYTFAIQSNGKIIIGGAFNSYNEVFRNRIMRINSDASLDTSFNTQTGANGIVRATSLQSDGKIIVVGNFNCYNNNLTRRIARLNSDGTLDATFDTGIGAVSSIGLHTTSIQNDGKIIIGGNLSQYNGVNRNGIARLNSDGSIDTTFDPGTGVAGGSSYSIVHTSALQSDGKIIIGGDFRFYNGIARSGVARLSADGSLDLSFYPGTGVGAGKKVYSSAIQSDGKIIIGGDFISYSDNPLNRIARLNTDGSIDTSFILGTGANNIIYTIALQSDGKIIIGGNFTSYNGTSINRIARLNSDGSLDTSFNPGTGANGIIYTTALQSDGKIIIGGEFTSLNGNSCFRLARLNTDGSLDSSFNPGTGANNFIYSTALQSDGKIIIGGDFTSYNNIGRNNITRINGGSSLTISDFEKGYLVFYPNPTQNTLHLEIDDEFTGSVFNLNGEELIRFNNEDLDVSSFSKGIYFLKITIRGKQFIKKFIKE